MRRQRRAQTLGRRGALPIDSARPRHHAIDGVILDRQFHYLQAFLRGGIPLHVVIGAAKFDRLAALELAFDFKLGNRHRAMTLANAARDWNEDRVHSSMFLFFGWLRPLHERASAVKPSR